MTKKEIMAEAIRIAHEAGLHGIKRFEYLAGVENSEVYKSAPETEPTLREQLETEVHKILDEISFKGFFNHPNRKKK